MNRFFSSNTIFLLKFLWMERAGRSREAWGSAAQKQLLIHSHSACRFSPPFLHIESRFLKKKTIFNYVCACASLCGYMHECTYLQKPVECIRHLVLVLQMVVDCLKWVLGNEFRFCTRVVCILNQKVTFLALQIF